MIKKVHVTSYTVTSNRIAAIFISEQKLTSTPITNYCKHVLWIMKEPREFSSSLAASVRSDKMSLDASLLFRPTYPKIFGESIAFFSDQVS